MFNGERTFLGNVAPVEIKPALLSTAVNLLRISFVQVVQVQTHFTFIYTVFLNESNQFVKPIHQFQVLMIMALFAERIMSRRYRTLRRDVIKVRASDRYLQLSY